MSKTEFLNVLAEMVEEQPGSLTGDRKLEDIDGWTSISLISFMAMADEHFGVRISPRQFGACATVDDLAKLVGPPEWA